MTSEPSLRERECAAPDRVHDAPSVLVLGASGYIGGRLVPDLLRCGSTVRCMSRSASSLQSAPWAADTEVVEGDLLDPDSLDHAFDGIDVVVYLVHSLGASGDFEDLERTAAANTRSAAARAGVRRIVYLSGLGDDDAELSAHLASRHAVGEELARSDADTIEDTDTDTIEADTIEEVIELRAAVVIGAGSASFEMLRSLAEVLPVMLAPPWVTRTEVQPIAIGDVLTYLVAAVEAAPMPDRHTVVQIGGPDRMTYRELIDVYCDVAGLKRRRIIPLSLIPLPVSSRWVDLVTPLPRRLARRLIESLEHDVVLDDRSATVLSAHHTVSARTAVELAIAAVDDLDVPTRWSGHTDRARASQPRPWDPDWAGGTVLEDRRTATTHAPPDAVMRTVVGIGGQRGWYGFGVLWWLRGLADQLVGGVGLRRGRRHPDEIEVGEALDFWRVEAVGPDLFRLRAEMRLPGMAWLEWSVDPVGETTEVTQRARFVPRGVWGRLYWALLIPFHTLIFPMMLRRILAVAEGARS